MGYVLRDGVSMCVAGERIFLLDILQDRYFCLGREADRVLRMLLKGTASTPSDHVALEPHIISGLLRLDQTRGSLAVCDAPIATEDCGHAVPSRLSLGRLPAMMFAIFLAERRLKRLGLSATLAIIAKRADLRASLKPAVEADPAALISAMFNRANYLVGGHDKCLPRSIALATYLNARQIDASIVFGIMGRPFSAHCWVQVGNCVMNDSLDTVRNYTPIKIV